MDNRHSAIPARPPCPVAMTVAGSDPSGGAGLQADLKTFAALGVYGFSVITAVIAQNSARVARVAAVEPAMVAAQIETVVAERMPDALKIGALVNGSIVQAVADQIEALELPSPVLDPVLRSTSGARLLDRRGERILRTRLLPLARIVTPNIPEAEVLSGIEIDGPAAMRRAARAIGAAGARAVLIKGGHYRAPGKGPQPDRVVDLLFDGRRFIEFGAPRLPASAHGTGCALSAALAAWLARGAELERALSEARRFLTGALQQAFSPGSGRAVLDHFAHWQAAGRRHAPG